MSGERELVTFLGTSEDVLGVLRRECEKAKPGGIRLLGVGKWYAGQWVMVACLERPVNTASLGGAHG